MSKWNASPRYLIIEARCRRMIDAHIQSQDQFLIILAHVAITSSVISVSICYPRNFHVLLFVFIIAPTFLPVSSFIQTSRRFDCTLLLIKTISILILFSLNRLQKIITRTNLLLVKDACQRTIFQFNTKKLSLLEINGSSTTDF